MFRFLLVVTLFCTADIGLSAQPLNFETTEYYTAQGKTLSASGSNLAAFSFSNAAYDTHPLRGDGIYYPVVDFENKNIWVRVRYLQPDPNGTTSGWNVGKTNDSPFRSGGFGGWWGFLYRFDIYADSLPTGTRSNKLGPLVPNNILVESIETLSWTEWLSFRILNPGSSGWFLVTKNLGSNPGSDPGFSDNTSFFPTSNLTTLYTPDFPNGADSIYAVDLPGGAFAEFRIGVNGVSSFLYGYEYDSPGGYQGMTLAFGQAPVVQVKPKLQPAMVYPNPTTGILHFEKQTTGTLLNAQGQEVLHVNGKSMSLEALPTGLYLLQAEGQAPVRIQKQ